MRAALKYLAICLVLLLASTPAMAKVPDVSGCTPQQGSFFSTLSSTPFGAPGSPVIVQKSITVSGMPGSIFDIDVLSFLTHDYSGDVLMILTSPGGSRATLTNGNGGGFDDLFASTWWDDQADDPVTDRFFFAHGAVPTLSPSEPFDMFRGENPNGVWLLTVLDLEPAFDGGSLNAFQLNISTCSPTQTSLLTVTDTAIVTIPDGGSLTRGINVSGFGRSICSVELTTTIAHNTSSNLDVRLESPRGTFATVTTDNGGAWDDVFRGTQWRSKTEDPVSDHQFTSNGVVSPLSPEESFAVFFGEDPNGNWRLHVADDTDDLPIGGAGGTLRGWSIQLRSCGYAPDYSNQTLPALAETAAVGSSVGYVLAREIFRAGAPNRTIGIGSGVSTTAYNSRLNFTADQDFTIRSVTAYPTNSGNIFVGLYGLGANPQTDIPLDSAVAPVSPGGTAQGNRSYRLPVDLQVTPGSYFLAAGREGGSAVTTTGGLFRNTSGASYPYTVLPVLSITGSSFGGSSYGFFYDWEIAARSLATQYALVSGNTGGAFALNASTGQITVADASAIDFETSTVFNLTIRATGAGGISTTRVVTIPILDVNEAPALRCPANVSIDDTDSLAPDILGYGAASDDTDPSPVVTYRDTLVDAVCPIESVITRRWTARDATGNTSNCNQRIEVRGTDLNGNGTIECEGEYGSTNLEGQCVDGSGDCFYDALQSSACGGVNGFLAQINIASVINLQPGRLRATVQFFDGSGTLRNAVTTTIQPNLKVDFIINDMGLAKDTVGTVCVVTDAGGRGAWTGGIAVYKPDLRNGAVLFGDAFDFALWYPFTNALRGKYTVPLNTFHLGTNPSATIANWISIADGKQGDGIGLTGMLRFFNDAGTLTKQQFVTIPDGGRIDYSGHDGLVGATNADAVGMAQFTPSGSAEFYMTLTRYFYDCPGASCENFLAAFNIPRRPGTQQRIIGGVSTVNNEITVVELTNVTAASSAAGLEVYNGNGAHAGNAFISVPARGTRHVVVNQAASSGFLAAGEIGLAEIDASSGNVSALSIFYKLNDAGVLEYAYAAPFVGVPGVAQLSQFNSFISQTNNPEFCNISSSSVTVTADYFDFLGNNIRRDVFALPPKGSRRFDAIVLPSSTYGTIIVQADSANVIVRNYVSRKDSYTLSFVGE